LFDSGIELRTSNRGGEQLSAAQQSDRTLRALYSYRCVLTDRHDHITIIKTHSSGRGKAVNRATTPDFLNSKIDLAIVDPENEGQTYFPEIGIYHFDPALKGFGVKGTHIADQHRVE
jgi:hypothetical protein